MDEKLEKLDDTSESSSEIAHTWNSSHELLLASIGDRCNCYRWLHERCQTIFEKYNFYLTVPSVIISTLAGSATIATPSMLSEPNLKTAGIIVGLCTLACGVLTSVNQYMKTAQFAESHRLAAIAFGKLHRVIASELALRRDQRANALDFIKIVRSEQDRLQETCPNILESAIADFKVQFKGIAADKPEIVGDITRVRINVEQKHDRYESTASNARCSPQEITAPE